MSTPITTDNFEQTLRPILEPILEDFGKKLKGQIIEEVSGLLQEVMSQIDERFNRLEAQAAEHREWMRVATEQWARHDHWITGLGQHTGYTLYPYENPRH